MRILGIDPGLRITGYGCVQLAAAAAEPTVIEAGVLRIPPGGGMSRRLHTLHTDLAEVIAEVRPELVVVESLFTHYQRMQTSILMGHARGVVLLAAQQAGIETDELAATEVKKAITGHGHATKQQMQLAIMQQCGLNAVPSPPDVADALAIALCAARRRFTEAVVSESVSGAAAG